MADKAVALRKRQQIENASRTMFMWVAIAAVVVGISAVVSVSIFKTMSHNQKVINAKNNTVKTLKKNNEVVESLKERVRVLNTNSALAETERLEGTEPLAVVLDALPSQPNSSALGASLQQKLLNEADVSIDSLVVEPIAGVEDSGETGSQSGEVHEIGFSFTVSANSSQPDALKGVLINLEKSIRTIDVAKITVEQQNNTLSMSVEGKAYYKTEVRVELRKKTV